MDRALCRHEMGAYFRDKGQHALIVFDDLSKHAATHLEIAMFTRRQPRSLYCRIKYGDPDRTTGIGAFRAFASLASAKVTLMIFAALSLTTTWDAKGLDVVEGQARFTLNAFQRCAITCETSSPWLPLVEEAEEGLACLLQKRIFSGAALSFPYI